MVNPTKGTGKRSGIQNLLPMLQMMSNSCDYGGSKCTCNHDPADLLMMQSLLSVKVDLILEKNDLFYENEKNECQIFFQT